MNISNFTTKTYEALKAHKGDIAITAYIPVSPSQSYEAIGRRAELRTLLKSIKSDVVDKLDITQAEDLIDHLSAMGEVIALEQRHGSVVLFSDGKSHSLFYTDLMVPSQIILDTSYELEPLKSVLAPEQTFFVLALSKAGAKLFKGDSKGLLSVDVPAIQKDYKEALRFDIDGKEVQGHSSSKGEVYHGQDDLIDKQKKYLAEYFRLIDKAIMRVTGVTGAPVVLAGVGYLADLYRKVSKNKHLADNIIQGNVLHNTTSYIWEKAYPLALATA